MDDESELFQELYPALRRYAAVVAPREDDPDDLVQEAVARTLRSRRLTDLDNPAAYLRSTITNLASNRRRSLGRGRRARGRLRPDDAAPAEYPSDLADLDALSPRDRAIIYLADVEGWSGAEIASMLELSENAVRIRASRCRRVLLASMTTESGGMRA